MGLHIHFLPEFKSQPSMIAGLPDMGNVAGIGLNFLSRKLNAQLFAEIHSYWPPFITYNNGIIDYSQASYKFYFAFINL
jgi:proteasome assembly chaperone (PAC2) family protein